MRTNFSALSFAVILITGLSNSALAQWTTGAIDTLTRNSLRDENSSQPLAIDNNGTLHATWKEALPVGGWRVMYSRKQTGSPWTAAVEIGDSALPKFDPVIAAEPATGHPTIAYQVSYGLSEEIAVSRDSSGTWLSTRLTTNGTEDLSSSIAIDGYGKTHVAWVGRDSAGNWKIYYATDIDGAWETQILIESDLGSFGSGAAPFLAVTSYGVAHIFYRGGDFSSYHIHHAENNAPGGTSWVYEIVSTPNGNDFQSSAVITADGSIHLLASGNDGFGFPPHAYYTVRPPSGSWSSPQLTNPNGAGWGGSLFIDPFGKEHIAWNETSGNIYTGNLFYATNNAGSWVSSPILTDGQTYNGVLLLDQSGIGHSLAYSGNTFQTQEIVVVHSLAPLTGVLENEIPERAILLRSYPNPFNPTTTIEYELPEQAFVKLSAFDVLGREVGVLAEGLRNGGRHTVQFNAHGFASGTYVARLELRSLDASNPSRSIVIRKLLLVK